MRTFSRTCLLIGLALVLPSPSLALPAAPEISVDVVELLPGGTRLARPDGTDFETSRPLEIEVVGFWNHGAVGGAVLVQSVLTISGFDTAGWTLELDPNDGTSSYDPVAGTLTNDPWPAGVIDPNSSGPAPFILRPDTLSSPDLVLTIVATNLEIGTGESASVEEVLTFSVVVPEPSTALLTGLGLACIAGRRRLG